MDNLPSPEKKEILKKIFVEAKNKERVDELKDELRRVFSSLHPIEIALTEQELVKEGLSWRDIYRMCDVHFELVKDMIVPSEELRNLPEGHPLGLLIWENTEILKVNEKAAILIRFGEKEANFIKDLKEVLASLHNMLRIHYTKNQFLIFPYIERRGVTMIPRVMWMKEDMLLARIRKLLQRIGELEKNQNKELDEEARSDLMWVLNEVRDIVSRENNILYPTVYNVLSDGEWLAISLEMEKIGFVREEAPIGEWRPEGIKPIYPWMLDATKNELKPRGKLPAETAPMFQLAQPDNYKLVRDGDIELRNGYLSVEEIEAILNHLPIEITYIDRNLRTRYFNEPKGNRFFLRTKTILGRPVKFCHPPRSEELVDQVIELLKNGKDYEDFWIDFKGRKLLIRFIAIRGENGDLKGILEVVMDITDLKNIEGEKRTLYS